MLSSKKVKYRKRHKGRMKNKATRGNDLAFGDFALQAVECGRITSRQIEAARIAVSRFIKRGGKIWIRMRFETQHSLSRRAQSASLAPPQVLATARKMVRRRERDSNPR